MARWVTIDGPLGSKIPAHPDSYAARNWRSTMIINCTCGQSYTAGQWPAGHYTVICTCGRTLLSRDGTGVHVGSAEAEPPTAETPYVIGADPAAGEGDAARGDGTEEESDASAA